MWQDSKQKLGRSCLTTDRQQSKYTIKVSCLCESVVTLKPDLTKNVLTAASASCQINKKWDKKRKGCAFVSQVEKPEACWVLKVYFYFVFQEWDCIQIQSDSLRLEHVFSHWSTEKDWPQDFSRKHSSIKHWIAGELQMPLSIVMFRYSRYIKGRFFLFLKSDYQVK